MTRLAASLLLAAVASLGLAVAPAGSQTSALKGHNSNAPVDIGADRVEVQDRADRAVFSGNVVVKQAELTLTAARLTVAYSNGGNVQIRRIDASGGVTVTGPGERAKGDFGIYDVERKIITLIGGVTLVREGNSVSGGRLVLDLDSGRAVMDSPGNSGAGGRVTGTFTVPQRKS
ncbi:MAG: LptA/OstA family protein [Alphaproteobacteria bacterium]|nr:LptA/OstA family protein [Alphaproteobacteria bacterium]MBV9371917.1 LptA/OstA family protein [Alphaproteobacteria bacterium]MBV9900438.1 LptA/OstA family protein [Alphaproteobacteria bacterium]